MKHFRIIRNSWVITIIGTILSGLVGCLFFKDLKGYAVGFVLGGITSMLNFNLVVRFVDSIRNEHTARTKGAFNYILRMGIYLFILYASFTTGFNIYTTALGFLVTKIAIILDALPKRTEVV